MRQERGQSLIEYALSWVVVGACLFAARSPAGLAFAQLIHDFYDSVSVFLR
jgi:hypothetical protein